LLTICLFISQTEGPASKPATSSTAVQKAEDVVSTMLAKGFVLGKDAVTRAKSFDQKLQLTSTASAKVASLDRKIGLSEKFSVGTSAVNGKVREVDNKFQVLSDIWICVLVTTIFFCWGFWVLSLNCGTYLWDSNGGKIWA
jgi:hypothetical protein